MEEAEEIFFLQKTLKFVEAEQIKTLPLFRSSHMLRFISNHKDFLTSV